MSKQKTTLLIRPAARGGKYLGHDAANEINRSALVALLHPETGDVVAHGFAIAPSDESAGPPNLMEPVSRSVPYACDNHTVQVQLNVEISEPTDFRVLVYGPLKHIDQARLAQADITVLPGVNIGTTAQNPEGLVIEIPGLCISNVTASVQGPQLSCFATVTMMCGCPIRNAPSWSWPDTDFTIQLVTCTQSNATYFYPLEFDNADALGSSFSGSWVNLAPNDQVTHAWIYASEPKLGNQGTYRILPAPHTPRLPDEIKTILDAEC